MIFGKVVNKYYLKYWYLFLFGIIALILVDYFQLEIPKIYGSIIDGVTAGSIDKQEILMDVLKIIGIGAIMFVGRFSWRNLIFGAGVRVEADLRDDMFNHSLKLSQNYYKEHKTGALLSYFTNDLQTVRMCFGQGTLMLIDALFLGIFTFYRMIKLNMVLAFVSLIPLLIISVASYFIGNVMEKKFLVRQKAYEDLSDFTQENISGISVIKAFVKEGNEIKAFKETNKKNQIANLSFAKFQVALDVIFTLVISGIVAALTYVGSITILKNKLNEFSAGDLTQFVSYFSTLTWPMMAISNLINMRAQGKASLKRVSDLLCHEIDIKDSSSVKNNEILGDITFNHLNFTYPDGPQNVKALNDISFHIRQGEMVGIIGKTGCGKTTIVDLLLRTYNLNPGEILIDGIDIMDLPFKKVRDAIGYVPQENFLFSDTIKNNIAFAYDNDIDDYKVENAAILADVHENIIGFEQNYKTVLGERGVTLSGGQKQRVSIARALIKDPAILIMDDSLSAVDTKTEEAILTNLKKLRQNKTTILIAHRISTVKDLDKIIILDDGKVSGIGTHDELLKSNSIYKELVRLQSLEHEIDSTKAFIEGGNQNEF